MADGSQFQALMQSKQTSEGERAGSKNIVICCDGTGNEFGDSNSNVVKLYTALAVDNDQEGYYHPGVGTMGDPGERHRLARWWSKVKGLAFADGFVDNVSDAYRYLMSVYNDGDRVYLFGFSRGAYTVRALAGLLDGYGLLCMGNEGHLPYAWRLYADQHADRKRHSLDHNKDSAAAFKETFSRKNFSIHFVGVWDTVSSVGWVTAPMKLFSVAQNRSMRYGRHALSIDERRCFYHDNIWGDALPGQDVKQVWFAGAHSDVGGSYSQETSGLSNISLKWMLDEAREAGLMLVEERVAMVLGTPSASYPESSLLYQVPKETETHRSLKGVWWVLEFFPHVYYDKDFGEELYRIPMGARRGLPLTGLVHRSVKELMDGSATYRPGNVMKGTLTAIPESVDAEGKPELYLFTRPDVKTSSFLRWVVMVLFCLLYAVVGVGLVWVVVKGVLWLWGVVF